MNKKHRGYTDGLGLALCILFVASLVGAIIGLGRLAHRLDAEAVKEHHQQIDASPVQTIDGQKFHVLDNHLYPIVKVAGEEKTIYN